MKNEKVLVIPTAYFHQLGHFQGFTRNTEIYIPQILSPEIVSFRTRYEVEEDPGFKQLIPYMLFRWISPEGKTHIFRYTRGKGMGEGRLHLKHSVGVGGHLSEEDCAGAPNNTAVYHTGMNRERTEEVRVETEILREQIVGLINDDLNPVGQVHLGVVHLIDVAEPKVYPNEQDVLETGFYPIEDQLRNLTGYESWSSITIEAIWGTQSTETVST
ncbi:MAG: phosphoesterase [Planctomycetia bacterium]|nr:phosphoesterase [Planctomycetia bacterium]